MVQYELLVKVDFASSCCFSLLVSVKMFLEVLQVVVLRDFVYVLDIISLSVCLLCPQLMCNVRRSPEQVEISAFSLVSATH